MLKKGRNGGFNFGRYIRKRIPIIDWLPTYSLGWFLQDLLAGFTVGMTEIPQGIAYALVAGLPSQYGLYSGFMGGMIYFILGSCKDLNVGPTAIMALMIQPYVLVMGPAAAVLSSFLSGCIIFLCGIFHLGFILVEFFSYPVISGFTTAAALNIASSQIKGLLGIKGKSDTFLGALIHVFSHITETRKWDTLLGLCSVLFLVFGKEISRYGSLQTKPEWSTRRNTIGKFIFLFSLARNALIVVFGTTLAYIFKCNGSAPFLLTGEVKDGLPPFALPPFSTNYNGTEYTFTDMASNFGAMIIFCPLVAILEHVAIARAFSKGKPLDATQELIALGVCNVFGSFVSSMPITGSFTRTAVNNASGAKTTTCGVITGLIVLLALGLLTSTFQYIPKATLASVIIVAMYYLCDFKAFPLLWKSKKTDLIPLIATLVCSLLISLEYGIIIGIATNLVFILYSCARPKITIDQQQSNVYLVKFKTGLHFAAANYIREFILENCDREKYIIVIDGFNVGNVDATVAKTFCLLQQELTLRDQAVIFWNFKPSIIETCSALSPNSRGYFKDGSLEHVLETQQISRI